jgi:2-amino-4-hydroxy-6-hydroxymethyldihydropteridine diphosphokinase
LAPKDYIVLTGLKISCIIGIFEWERKQKQHVLIDLKFPCDIKRASRGDRITDTVDYKKIAKATIAFVEKSRYQLIETLAEKLAHYLLTHFSISEIDLSVSKPGAIRGSQNVGIQIHRKSASRKVEELAYLGLGSNINPQQNLQLALEEIHKNYGIAGLSHVYQTSPVGYAKQAPFWNMVAAVQTTEKPQSIRKWAGKLEKKAGRSYSVNVFGPRTLDVDLLLWGSQNNKYVDFQLPHPDIETKAFVLFPLLEINPNLMHPNLRLSLIEIAAKFKEPSQKIHQLDAATFPDFPPTSLMIEPAHRPHGELDP